MSVIHVHSPFFEALSNEQGFNWIGGHHQAPEEHSHAEPGDHQQKR